MKIIMFTVWIMLFVFIIDLCLNMVSSANTIENIIGVFGVVITTVLSYKTKCLTAIKIKIKKHEN